MDFAIITRTGDRVDVQPARRPSFTPDCRMALEDARRVVRLRAGEHHTFTAQDGIHWYAAAGAHCIVLVAGAMSLSFERWDLCDVLGLSTPRSHLW